MKYSKILIGLQIFLISIGLKSRYDFLFAECSCHPNENYLFYFTTFFIIILSLLIINIAIKNKKTVWLFPVFLMTIYYVISENFSTQSATLQHDSFEPIKKIHLKNTEETNQWIIYLYGTYYRLIIYEGEECGCNYKGTYSVIKDTIRFENNITLQTDNLIPSSGFLIQKRSIVNLNDPKIQFKLVEATPP